jgi:hypothetical protein
LIFHDERRRRVQQYIISRGADHGFSLRSPTNKDLFLFRLVASVACTVAAASEIDRRAAWTAAPLAGWVVFALALQSVAAEPLSRSV